MNSNIYKKGMNTYNTLTESEAIALTTYFGDCGFPATRKGLVVKVKGDSNIINHLYEKFVTIAVI